MKNLSDDASLPQTIPALTAEIQTIDALLAKTEQEIKELMYGENPQQGTFFAQEIHELRQQKLVLLTRQELRRTRIRQIQAGLV